MHGILVAGSLQVDRLVLGFEFLACGHDFTEPGVMAHRRCFLVENLECGLFVADHADLDGKIAADVLRCRIDADVARVRAKCVFADARHAVLPHQHHDVGAG